MSSEELAGVLQRASELREQLPDQLPIDVVEIIQQGRADLDRRTAIACGEPGDEEQREDREPQ